MPFLRKKHGPAAGQRRPERERKAKARARTAGKLRGGLHQHEAAVKAALAPALQIFKAEKARETEQNAEKDKLQEEHEKLYENEGMAVNLFNNVKTLDDIDNYYNLATGNFDSYYLKYPYYYF